MLTLMRQVGERLVFGNDLIILEISKITGDTVIFTVICPLHFHICQRKSSDSGAYSSIDVREIETNLYLSSSRELKSLQNNGKKMITFSGDLRDWFMIGTDIQIKIYSLLSQRRVWICVVAPKEILILREELVWSKDRKHKKPPSIN